jgi:ATP-dependent RNA helicase RhlE
VRNTILFARARAGAERYTRQMAKRGYTVATLDDYPSQTEREHMLDDLKRGRVQILVASDSVTRSLDLAGVAHIINADVPQAPEDYVHRLGRGSAPDAVGDVFTLMSPEEQKNVAAIERLLGRAIPRVLLPDFDYNMHPTEFQQVVSYGDEPPLTRRVASGLQLAAAKIAAVPKGGAAKSGAAPKASGSGKNGVPARPGGPALKAVPASASDKKSAAAKSAAKSGKVAHSTPGRSKSSHAGRPAPKTGTRGAKGARKR